MTKETGNKNKRRLFKAAGILLIVSALAVVVIFVNFYKSQLAEEYNEAERLINQRIAWNLYKAPKDLTEEDFQSVKTLRIGGQQISSLKPLAKLPNLEKITFDSIKIPQIKRPAWLKKIRSVFGFANNDKSITYDVRPLGKLKNLKELSITYTSLYKIQGLEKLNNLQKLDLSNNPLLIDIESISSLVNLENINLHNTGIHDIAALKKLVNLKYLDLTASNGVSDLSPVSELIRLETLMVNSTPVTDLRILEKLGNLRKLEINVSTTNDISTIGDLTNLETLWLAGGNINDIEPLSKLEKLINLSLYCGQVSDITPLLNLKNLKTLILSSSKYTREGKCITDEQLSELKKALPELTITDFRKQY